MMVMERAVGEGLWLVSCVEDVSRAVVLQVETLPNDSSLHECLHFKYSTAQPTRLSEEHYSGLWGLDRGANN